MNRKIDISKLHLLPVPPGLKIKYQHHYIREVLDRAVYMNDEPRLGPPVLIGTEAWLENAEGERLAEGTAEVHFPDVPIKKLGKAIAHNRCIKAYLKNAPIAATTGTAAPAIAGA